ncbi:hypothetical protein AMATHDRAFT_70847 [Amanita thiersii Skay4041]|uniref:Uncharacterized protein n=1 Tax=Amanita thiersii Skay4041 TaxID=703135 RepID=A0A2A9NDY8_9AGAR|nr:hypothetical protein AMATHDRAFT_70847 [Amanita thiersii Skay4041]
MSKEKEKKLMAYCQRFKSTCMVSFMSVIIILMLSHLFLLPLYWNVMTDRTWPDSGDGTNEGEIMSDYHHSCDRCGWWLILFVQGH